MSGISPVEKHLLNNFKTDVQTDVVDKLLCADDLAENAKSEEKMQGAVDRMSKACDNFQLTISTKKLR